MSNSIRQKLTSILCVFLVLVTPSLITSCSVGPGGISAAVLSLSKSSAAPGELITLYSQAITQGATMQATFRTGGGYEVIVELVNTQDGSGQVMVPPYLDSATGDFQAGAVSVSISGVASEQGLSIGDLPDAGKAQPGEIMRAVLQVAIESYEFNMLNIGTIDDELGDSLDTSDTNVAIIEQISKLQLMLGDLDSTGRVTVDMGDGETAVLGSDELRIADRILLALLVQTGSSAQASKSQVASRNIVDCLKIEDASQRESCIYDVIDAIRRDTGRGTNLASMVATGVGLTFFVGGLYFGAGAVALTGLIVGAIGVAASFSNAAVNEQNTDAFLNRNGAGFNASQEAASQSVRFISGAASNLPGPPGVIAGATNAGLAVKDLVEGAVSERCRSEDSRRRSASEIAEFCSTVQGGGSSGDGSGGDGGGGGGGGTTGGTFSVLNYMNIDGSMGSNAASANISLSGSATAPVISWSVSNVFVVSVTSGLSVLYGINGERKDSQGNTEQVPFTFSSITYGDYSRANTVRLDGTSTVAPALQPGAVLYSITIGTLSGKSAALNFKVVP